MCGGTMICEDQDTSVEILCKIFVTDSTAVATDPCNELCHSVYYRYDREQTESHFFEYQFADV
jgi:hypothetical protein